MAGELSQGTKQENQMDLGFTNLSPFNKTVAEK
ncbi:hypothetical protein ES703_14742 [subsurface metagenome]